MFACSPVPFAAFAGDGRLVAGNRAYHERFGHALPDLAALRELLPRAGAGETVRVPAGWCRSLDARRLGVACDLFPLPGGDRRVGLVVHDLTAELTAREQAEAEAWRLRDAVAERDRVSQALRESEARLTDTLEAAEIGTWEWNIADDQVQWSANIERIFGLDPGTFAGTYAAWQALLHPDDRGRIEASIQRSLATQEPYEAEFRFLRPDGSTGWQSTRGYVLADERGRPRLLRGVVLDVTARHLAEDAVKMPALVLDSMSEGVSIADGRGILRYTNPATDRMFGYESGELLGHHVTVLNAYPLDDNHQLVTEVMDQVRAGEPWSGEWWNRRKDGTTFTTRARITALERDGELQFVCVQEDVSDEVELQTALRDSEARYRGFVSRSTEGIWRCELREPVAVDAPEREQVAALARDAYLAECNDAMAHMYGLEHAAELHGKRLPELWPEAESRGHERLAAFVRGGYRLENAETQQRTSDGQRRVFQDSLVGMVEDGRLRRAWGTRRDVTAQVEAHHRAEAANRAKDEFLAMLGHELRNPLSPILTALELMKLRDAAVFEKERAVIERQVKHMVRLVDDLLDVSRMTRGKVSIEHQRVDLADAVASALEIASPLLEQRAHRLSVQVPRGLVVDGDPTRLGQVFANLLTNAAKYTPHGGHVAVTGEREGGRARVTVRDTGIGIRPEILPRVFDLFVQEHQALDRSEGGLGLGLAIVRSLVGLHGGSVEARSQGPGHGSEFAVYLPVYPETPRPPKTPAPAPTPPRRDGARILIVDDNQDAADMLAVVLADWGFTVRVARDGPTALRVVEQFAPDVGLLDIGLPVMDGYELARRLRAEPSLAGVRLIAVTGYGQAKDRAAAEQAGFDDHFVKPVDLAALKASLTRLLPVQA